MVIQNNTSLSQNKLEDWLRQHRPLLDIFLDAFCIVDTNNRVVDFNEAFMELTGESYRKVLKIADFCTLLKMQDCPDQCPARQVMATNRPLRMDEIRGESRAYPSLQMILGAVPIVADTGETMAVLLTIRNVTAESELQKKYDERKKDAILDGLTQLYNKTYTEGALLRAVKATIRYGESHKISVIMSDIDHFKKVNDTYGHQAGDHVLTTVAQILKSEARETDIVGRFGGEEFTTLLYATDVDGARVFAERVRARVQATRIEHEGTVIPVTVSLGTASFIKSEDPKGPAEALTKEIVRRADSALYYSKESGRNRVTQFETLPPKKVLKGASKKAA